MAASGLLTGKTVLVTGASSGIGAAAARLFVAEGANVVLAARRTAELAVLVDELGPDRAEAVGTDVTRRADVEAAVQRAVARFGGLDGAFNNAGFGAEQIRLHEFPDELYDQIMDVNVRGVFHCLRAELAVMSAVGRGAIVNTSSVGGVVATPVAAAYIASKHAVIGLTKAAAVEYAPHGIRVNAIAPGTTRSEMMVQWFERNPGVEAALHAATPQRRTAEGAEIAHAAAWLLSDRASFTTGETLVVDGGFTVV